MENKGKNILISIIITVLVFVAVISYCALFISVTMLGFRVIGLIVLLGFSFAMILVLRERIKEIKNGETDDLSKY